MSVAVTAQGVQQVELTFNVRCLTQPMLQSCHLVQIYTTRSFRFLLELLLLPLYQSVSKAFRTFGTQINIQLSLQLHVHWHLHSRCEPAKPLAVVAVLRLPD